MKPQQYFGKQVASDVTVVIASKDNMEALTMCVSHVLQGAVKPTQIIIRLEGDQTPGFYFSQLQHLARVFGISLRYELCDAQGIRIGRDWLLSQVQTKYALMVDDDVMLDPCALKHLRDCIPWEANGPLHAFACGSKADVANNRGYTDFTMDVRPAEEATDDCSFNHLYQVSDGDYYVDVHTMDTGFVMLNIPLIRKHRIVFDQFPGQSLNCGGEDTLFALACDKARLAGHFVPAALAWHLEKPKVRFNEFAARGEMLLRACELKGYDKSRLKAMMPWIWPK